MKKASLLLVLLLVVSFCTVSFAQISVEDAVPKIEAAGILSVSDGALTYDDFHAAIAKAFPGKENLVSKGNEDVLRKDFIMALVAVLGLEEEAATYNEVCAMAVDEDTVPSEAIGAVTLAYRTNHQLLTNVAGGKIAPLDPISKEDAARALYQAMNPPKMGGTVVTAVGADPAGFNTLFTSAGLTWTIGNIIGDGLMCTDEEGIYVPRMITTIPTVENDLIKINDDGSMSVTYKLRKGMKWHDGEPITANDAKFQWEVMISDAPVTTNYFEKTITEVEIVDDYTYTLYFDEPAAGAEYGSSEYAYYTGWFQLPEHVYRDDFESAKETGKWEEFSSKVTNNPIMSGAYKFKEYAEGQRVVFEAFDGFFMGKPNVDEIVMRIVPDSNSIFASVLNGEIDFGRYTLYL